MTVDIPNPARVPIILASSVSKDIQIISSYTTILHNHILLHYGINVNNVLIFFVISSEYLDGCWINYNISLEKTFLERDNIKLRE